MKNEINGYSLFNDIDDEALRDRNRAVVMANMADVYTDKKRKNITPRGSFLILSYFNAILPEQRKNLINNFMSMMKERGYETNVPS